MAELNRTPNPIGSPNEKLLTENPLERIEDYIRGKLGEGPVTNEELVEVFRFYDERLQYEVSKQNRILELWANIHTHPGTIGSILTVLDGPWADLGAFTDGDYWWEYGGGVDAVYENEFYRLGRRQFGSNGNGGSQAFDLTNFTVRTLTSHPNLGNARITEQARIDNKFYVLCVNSNSTEKNKLYEYDPVGNAWTLKADWPDAPANQAQMAAHKGKLYTVYAGSELYSYNPSTNSWTNEGSVDPSITDKTNLCSDGNYLYVTGDGFHVRWDAGTWESRTLAPTDWSSGGDHATQFVNGVLYLFSVFGNDVMNAYNPQLDEWTILNTADEAPDGSALTGQWEGKLVVLNNTTVKTFG